MYLRSDIPKSSSLCTNLKVSLVKVTLVKKCSQRCHPLSSPPSPTLRDLFAILSLSDSIRDIKQSLRGYHGQAIFGSVRDQISINQQWRVVQAGLSSHQSPVKVKKV